MTRLAQDSYLRNKELVALNSGKQTTVGSGGFFVYSAEDYARKKRISRRSFFSVHISPISLTATCHNPGKYSVYLHDYHPDKLLSDFLDDLVGLIQQLS